MFNKFMALVAVFAVSAGVVVAKEPGLNDLYQMVSERAQMQREEIKAHYEKERQDLSRDFLVSSSLGLLAGFMAADAVINLVKKGASPRDIAACVVTGIMTPVQLISVIKSLVRMQSLSSEEVAALEQVDDYVKEVKREIAKQEREARASKKVKNSASDESQSNAVEAKSGASVNDATSAAS